MPKLKKTLYMGKDLTLEKWLELMKTRPKNVGFEYYMFPTDDAKDRFIEQIHTYDEATIQMILRSFLELGPILGSDKLFLQVFFSLQKADPNEAQKILEKSPYHRRLLASFKSNGKVAIYDSILWILDLLPDSPREALDVLSAYINLHIIHLPDGRIHGLSDAELIIRARYFDIKYDSSVLYSLKPDEFEYLIEALYHERGYTTYMTKVTHDGGRDIIAEQDKPGQKERNLIQCKRLKGNVDFGTVVQILGNVTDEKATKGTVVTTAGFTAAAKKFAKKNPRIDLIDHESLQKLLNEYLGTSWPIRLESIIRLSKMRHPKEKRI